MALKGVPKSPEHRAKLAEANRGKTHSAETKAKMSAASRGRKKTLEHRAAISAGRTGIQFSDETRAKMAASARVRAMRLGERERRAAYGRMSGGNTTKPSPDVRRKMSLAKMGHEPHWPRDKRVEYKGVRFRSSWEVRVAAALDELGMRWEYEPTRFDFGDQTYRPDFYLPDEGVYWEVKGYFTPRAQRAVRLFRERQSEPLVVVNEAAMVMLERAAGVAA